MPSDTQILLLAAAADPTGEPRLLWEAGKDLGFDTGAATAAEARPLVTIGASVRFRHPLVRSAVYYGAPLAERQRVHAALARATSQTRDPERRAWHQGAATSGLDETVGLNEDVASQSDVDRTEFCRRSEQGGGCLRGLP